MGSFNLSLYPLDFSRFPCGIIDFATSEPCVFNTQQVAILKTGVLVGVLLVVLTQWYILDSIVALVVAVNIIWTAVKLLRQTGLGLLDIALPQEDQARIKEVLAPYQQQGISFHALRSRMSGRRRFVSFHIIVPGLWTVLKGHTLCEEIELALHHDLPDSTIFTHLEPKEGPMTFEDMELDRTLQRE